MNCEPRRVRRFCVPAITAMLLAGACASDASEPTAASDSATPATSETDVSDSEANAAADPTDASSPEALFPDILEAAATESDGAWTFDVTVSSPYDSPERYADGFRVLGPDGAELGFRLLTHDHASEQPFTRSLDGVAIPDGISSVTIEGRDQVSGFGGDTVEVALPGR